MQQCNMQRASTVWWRNGKTVLDQRKVGFCKQKKWKQRSIARVCGSKQISVYEMHKKQQTRENARKMSRTKVAARTPNTRCRVWAKKHLGRNDIVRREAAIVRRLYGAESVRAIGGTDCDSN